MAMQPVACSRLLKERIEAELEELWEEMEEDAMLRQLGEEDEVEQWWVEGMEYEDEDEW